MIMKSVVANAVKANNSVALNWKRSEIAMAVRSACDSLVAACNQYRQNRLLDVDSAEEAEFAKMHKMIADLHKMYGVFNRERG